MITLKGFESALKKVADKAESLIGEQKPLIIAIAGTSASGKTTFASRIASYLEGKGYKVHVLNADNFYSPHTPKYHAFYDSFDHELIIEHNELYELVKQIKSKAGKGKFKLPIYSFEKATRVGYQDLDFSDGKDVVIVEGIYVLKYLKDIADINIFIKSESYLEEIVRRMIRDTEGERLNLDVGYSLNLIVGAYVMFDLFGRIQENYANYVIINDYNIFEVAKDLKKAKVIDEKELEQRMQSSQKSIWYHYEDEESIKMIVQDVVAEKLVVYFAHGSNIIAYELGEKMFLPLHLLAKVLGLRIYKMWVSE